MDIFRRENIPVYWLSMGDRLEYDGVTIDVLWPDGEKIRTGQNANDLPLVLGIDLGGVTIFQAADLTGKYEMYCVRPCDVLKVAHHGSWDSTSPEFLEAASPGTAIVTCASGRQLPTPDTMQRLRDAGIATFRTDEDGDITIRMGQRGPVISPWKP
jgi:competence protein ComEC